MKKEQTTFIQFGKFQIIPIPFWLYVTITHLKIKCLTIKLWLLRRLGIVYDPEARNDKR